MRKLLTTLALSVLLLGCGGHTEDSSISMGVYGDSYTDSTPDTVEIIKPKLPQLSIHSFAEGGTTALIAVTGSWLPSQSPPFTTFDKHIKTSTDNIILIRYGVADVILGHHTTYKDNMEHLIISANTSSKQVILVNVPNLPLSSVITPEMKLRLEGVNLDISALSTKYDLPVIDIYNKYPTSDIVYDEDQLHLSGKTTVGIANEIAKQLKQTLAIN